MPLQPVPTAGNLKRKQLNMMTNTQNHLLNTTSGCVWFVSCSMLPASALNRVQAAFLLLYFKVQICPPEPFMTRSSILGPFLLTLLIFKFTARLGRQKIQTKCRWDTFNKHLTHRHKSSPLPGDIWAASTNLDSARVYLARPRMW